MAKSKNKKSKAPDNEEERPIAKNRRATHDYSVVERFEVGIALQGTEVKSLRAGQLSFKDAFAIVSDGELWLVNLHIDEYTEGNRYNHLPTRKRKLLMKKRDILKLGPRLRKDGFTLIPLRLYFRKSWVKVELGLCKGKKHQDQRQDIAKRDAKRQIDRAMKRRREE